MAKAKEATPAPIEGLGSDAVEGMLNDPDSDFLSPEEQAALNDDDTPADPPDPDDEPAGDPPAAADEPAAPAADDTKPPEPSGDEPPVDGGGEPAAAAVPEGDTPPAEGDVPAGDTPEQTGDAEGVPAPELTPPAGIVVAPIIPVIPDEDIQALKQTMDEGYQKFEDGDISHAEYQDLRDAYNNAVVKRDTAMDMNIASRNQAWETNQQFYLGQFKELSIPMYANAFVGYVNQILDLKTDEVYRMTDIELLEAARKNMEKDNGFVLTHINAAAEEPAPAKEDPPAPDPDETRRKAAKTAAGKATPGVNLGDLPAAGAAGDGEEAAFAALDKLEGEAYEEALARLTPTQRERYEDFR